MRAAFDGDGAAWEVDNLYRLYTASRPASSASTPTR